MSKSKHTPGPWIYYADLPSDDPNWHIVTTANKMRVLANVHIEPGNVVDEANARLIAASPETLEALKEGRRAIGNHFAPDDCYATGPLTGDAIRDLVQCPACTFIGMYEAVLAKIEGRS
ncbi:hypothetical protein G6K93_07510 [Agrobacterium rhizogenes]|nr:hypothetical protein [Rhizobium rhizogenes]